MRYSQLVRFALLLTVGLSAHRAIALDIVGTYVPNGQPFSVFPGVAPANAGPQNPNTAGGGSFTEIFNTAASYWEAAILDPHTIQIEYGWVNIPPSAETLIPSSPIPADRARIMISSTNGSFFADPTPTQNEEWGTYTEFQANLGGGTVNSGRRFAAPSGAASGRTDLMSLFMHEIGHALGVNPFGTTPFWNITSPLPFAGTSIPRVQNFHFDGNVGSVANALMVGTFPNGQRRLPSAIDILAPAQHSGWTIVVLDPNIVPEPNAKTLVLILAVSLISCTRLRFDTFASIDKILE